MSGAAYYNENDPFAAAWLRELIKAGLIADGEVDERSIEFVRPDDLRGFVQCHFFAGIGGWSYALRIAGWPDDRDVWTGSCPCQPFSSAGAQIGGHDPRDLWPVWFQLVRECRPVVVFGEQVEAAIGHGWLDRLCDDLEAEGYAVGACGLPAASVGAFHIRQRLWFVADASGERRQQDCRCPSRDEATDGWQPNADHIVAGDGADGGMAESGGAERGSWRAECCGANLSGAHAEPAGPSDACELADAGQEQRRRWTHERGPDGADQGKRQQEATERRSDGRDVAHAEAARSSHRRPRAIQPKPRASGGSPWTTCDWLPCIDGKARPVEPGTFPLAHGVSARVGRLRGYGNAIVPPVAAAFIEAYLDARSGAGNG